MTITDGNIIAAMHRYGGQFEKALAVAALKADDENLARIKTAFPEMWEKYQGVSETKQKET